MYEKFTNQARAAMTRANNEARDYHHHYIGTEHILLGLLYESAGISGDVLDSLGVDPMRVREEIEKLVIPGPAEPTVDNCPLTPRALESLEFACQEALYTCQGHVDTEHLLLGLLREPDGVAGVVLRNLGLNLEATREEVLKIRVLQMKIVERAVRPILATLSRRLKMREELLAHLTEIYDEERIRERDPVQATLAAARRFGDPAELARELQTTVPWTERWEATLDRWFGRRTTESDIRCLTRGALQMALGLALVTTLVAVICIARFGWTLIAGIALRPFVAMNVLIPATFMALALVYLEMRNTYYGVYGRRRSLTRFSLLGAAFTSVVTVSGTILATFSAWSWEPLDAGLVVLVILGLIGAVFTYLVARENGLNEIREAYWADLDLET